MSDFGLVVSGAMAVRQLVYISTASNLDAAEVERILEISRKNNAEAGISGFLLYNGRNFLQLVEGEEQALTALYDRLGSDPRHDGMVRLADEPIAERSCPDWQMHQLRLADDVIRRRELLMAELPDKLSRDIRQLVLNFAALN
ncbi:MAG: BLUF domain-containing protein [Sphingomonadaceae bacterium]|nr:BLUF domain-containing protein [Sphingomonadaceae bacterium]